MVDVVFEKFWKELKEWYGKDTKRKFDVACETLFKNVPSNSANDVLKYITYNYDFFPKFTEFKNIAAKFEVTKEAPVTDERCVYCLGSGLIKYTIKDKGLPYNPEYFAACMCSKGRRYRGNPIKGIEDVYRARTSDVLKQLGERNAPRKSVSELQADFVRGMEIMNLRSQGFKSREV